MNGAIGIHWGWQVFEAAVKSIFLILLFAMPLGGFLTWMERRQSAMMQDRLGPNRATIPIKFLDKLKFWGLLHVAADGIKMIFKEDNTPKLGSRFLFELAPILALVPVLIIFAVIPFGDTLLFYMPSIRSYYASNLIVAPLNTGLLFIFAVTSLTVYGTVLAGYSPDSKLGMLGALRASAQMFSYEVAMGLTIVGVMMVYSTVRLDEIARAQDGLLLGFLPAWGVFLQPVGFVLFLTASIAETKRAPFDLPEGESEIVGYFVEYSGFKFATFMLAEFIEVVAVAALVTTMFFGSYHIPYLSWRADVIPFFNAKIGADTIIPYVNIQVVTLVVSLLQFLVFAIKVLFFSFFQLLIRWSVPRFRYDQLMNLGWKLLLPLAMINMAVTAVLILIFGSK